MPSFPWPYINAKQRVLNIFLISEGKKRSSVKKKAYDTAYHATPERVKYRSELNKANRKNPNKKGIDKSHTKSGKIVNEKQSTNRARNKPGRSKK